MNRVWTYIISKALSEQTLNHIVENGKRFVSEWTAHENKLEGSFDILYGRIILVKVNEAVNGASGCSIDKLTRFVKETETNFNIELLNRLLIAYKKDDRIEVIHASKVKELLLSGAINENTVVLNTSVANEHELEGWEQPLKKTWLNKYLAPQKHEA